LSVHWGGLLDKPKWISAMQAITAPAIVKMISSLYCALSRVSAAIMDVKLHASFLVTALDETNS